MVCPNCHSNKIIAVQDQHFCINCGQMVPETAIEKQAAKPHVAVQANGLPEGVKILPVAPGAASPPTVTAAEPPIMPHDPPAAPPHSLIRPRSRLVASESTPPPAKRRKPGRPKAGRLDVPHTIASASVPASLPAAPRIASVEVAPPAPSKPIVSSPIHGPRRMSDLAPRRPAAKTPPPPKPPEAEAKPTPPAKSDKKGRRSRPQVHKVGIPPLHYTPALAFSLRARARPRLIALSALGAASLGGACAYGVWLLLSRGVSGLADSLMQAGPSLIAEAILLALAYYIGRSLGQTAITYGIAREADARPVTLSRQLGVAINTFGRRLQLDIGYGLAELALLAIGAALFLTGGEDWNINLNLQISLIFGAFLVILYALSALALSRGIAGVNLTLTTHRARTAARLGWQLFSHRIELIGPRFGALLLEALLAVPLIALAVAGVLAAPPQFHLLVAIGAGLLAWLAGALLGVGTAAWWTVLYRQLVLTDRPNLTVALLSSRQPEDARRGSLALLVALSTLIITATLVLPWLRLT